MRRILSVCLLVVVVASTSSQTAIGTVGKGTVIDIGFVRGNVPVYTVRDGDIRTHTEASTYSVFNGKTMSEPLKWVGKLAFLPDGKTFVYRMRDDQDRYVVINNELSGPFGFVLGLFNEQAVLKFPTYVYRDNSGNYFVHGDTSIEVAEFPPVLWARGIESFTYLDRGPRFSEFEGLFFVVAGEKRYGPYDGVEDLSLAYDGKTPVFRARKGTDWYIVAGEKEFGPYQDDQLKGPLVLEPQGLTGAGWAFRIDDYMVGDHSVRPRGIFMPNPRYSPGRNSGPVIAFAFVAKQNDGWYVYHGEDREGPYNDVQSLRLSSDGQTLSYTAFTNAGVWLHEGNRVTGPYSEMPRYYIDAGKLAFGVPKSRMQIPENGEDFGPNDILVPLGSAGDKNLAYWYTTNNRARKYVVVGKVKAGPYKEIDDVHYSASGSLVYTATADAGMYLVVNNQKFGPYELVDSLTYSPDYSSFACRVVSGGRWYVSSQGKLAGPYLNLSEITFSPVGSRLAYAAAFDQKWHVVVDGRPVDQPDRVQSLAFSPDGKVLTYKAVIGPDNVNIPKVLIAGKEYTGTMANDRVVYIDAGTIYLK